MVTYPSSWSECQFGAVIDTIEAGVSVRSYDSSTALPAVLKTSALGNGRFDCTQRKSIVAEDLSRARTEVRPDSLLISRMNTPALVGMVGYVSHAPESVFLPDRIWRVQGKRVNLQWLGYMLSSTALSSQIRELATGTSGSMKNIPKQRLLELTIPTPLLTEQRAIAEVLSGFDEHLANLDELIAKKKAIRDGAIENLISGTERLSGFNGEWVDMVFGQAIIPKARIGWQNLRTDEYLDTGYSYIIGGTDFSDGTVDLASCKFVSKERFLMDPAIQVNQGDILVTKDGTIGKVAVVPSLERPATLNSGVYVFRSVGLVTTRFLYWVLRSTVFDDFIAGLSAGSTIKHLYQKDLGNFHFRAPKDTFEQDSIAEVMSSLETDLHVLKEERAKVQRLKLGAMDDLLTGRVRLPMEEEAA